MRYTPQVIEEIFTYHAPTPEEQLALKAIREKAREFAETIVKYTHESPDQTAAIRKLRECVMTVNACIVLGGRVS